MTLTTSRSDRIVGKLMSSSGSGKGRDAEAGWSSHIASHRGSNCRPGTTFHFCLLILLHAISFSVKSNSEPCESRAGGGTWEDCPPSQSCSVIAGVWTEKLILYLLCRMSR